MAAWVLYRPVGWHIGGHRANDKRRSRRHEKDHDGGRGAGAHGDALHRSGLGADKGVGTKYADHLTGKHGDDFLEGRAGNDVYHFDDGFGNDILVEPRKVGTSPGGIDTLSFSEVSTDLAIPLVPQWAVQGYNKVSTQNSGGFAHRVSLGSSVVERAVGGSGHDSISTGAGANTLKGGAGVATS